MKHTKEQKQLINEWLEKYNETIFTKYENKRNLTEFQKQHNLIKDELEVGKWYLDSKKENTLYFIYKKDSDGFNSFGIHLHNKWLPNIWHRKNYEYLVEATYSYVIECLTWYSENVMKYNHEKPNYKCLFDKDETIPQRGELTYCLEDGEFYISSSHCAYRNCLMKDGKWSETFEVEQPIKPTYKSKGGEHGKRIIDKLVELGGINTWKREGKNVNEYYFIDSHGEIDLEINIPQGYTECFLEEEEVKHIQITENIRPFNKN